MHVLEEVFRSTIAISRRKANRKEHRAVKRQLYRQLGKCHPVKATQGETYVVVQECHSTADTLHDKNPLSRSLKPEKTEIQVKAIQHQDCNTKPGWWNYACLGKTEGSTQNGNKQNRCVGVAGNPCKFGYNGTTWGLLLLPFHGSNIRTQKRSRTNQATTKKYGRAKLIRNRNVQPRCRKNKVSPSYITRS